ncbi:MAG: succinylglutamate desuccinylase/aspartoacylase family protein, partial [Gemmatimonadota bacterium]|nr:succinylglutamate desuccinylase/aspartoacylase family protein [Gemmatimonadota bacterium]
MAVRRGTKRRLEIPIARLPTGVFLSLPVAVVHGRRPGPCVWLSAALHGDEINGVEIIRDALQPLDPETLRGTILAVPVVNVFGFVAES